MGLKLAEEQQQPPLPGFRAAHADLSRTAKRESPDWTPPAQMLRRRPDLPRHMRGRLDNPLGARAPAEKERADVLVKAVETGRVTVMVLPGSTPVALDAPRLGAPRRR